MALSKFQSSQPEASSVPAYRKLQQAVLAACILLAPLVIFLGFAFDPQLGVPQTANAYSAYIAAARAENPVLFQCFLFFNVVTPYVFPLSYLGLGWLAMGRSPWLATIGTACGLAEVFPGPSSWDRRPWFMALRRSGKALRLWRW